MKWSTGSAVAFAASMVAVLTTAIALTGNLSAQEPPVEGIDEGGIETLAACLADGGDLLAVILVDQSGSLRLTDPTANRVDAATALIASLESLAQQESPQTRVFLHIAGFGESYEPVRPWTEVTPATKPDLVEAVEQFRSRDTDDDTDYYLALEGAQAAFAQYPSDSADTTGSACKVLVWFTDGEYSIDSAAAKPYAPGVRDEVELIRVGRDGLCRTDGVVDQLHAQGVVTLAVALAFDSIGADGVDDMSFLGAVATGTGTGVTTTVYECGEPDSTAAGEFVPVGDVGDLIAELERLVQQIVGGVATPCPIENSLATVAVDSSIDRLSILVDTDSGKGSVRLTSPDGASADFSLNEETTATVGGGVETATAIGSRLLKIEILPQDQSTLEEGDWVVDGVGATCLSHVDGGVVGRVEDQDLLRGEPATLEITLTTPDGQTVDVGDIRGELNVAAVVVDPESGLRTPLDVEITGAGVSALFTPPGDLTAPGIEVVVASSLTRPGGQELENIVSSRVRVRPPETIVDDEGDVVTPPRLRTSELRFPSITGTGASSSTIEVDAGDVDAELCIADLAITATPGDSGAVTLEPSSTCIPIAAGDDLVLPVEIAVADEANGTVRGTLDLDLDVDGTKAIPYSIPVSVDLRKPLDIPFGVLLFMAMLLGGIGAPIGLYLIVDRWRTRFGDLTGLRYAQVAVAARTDGLLERIESGETLAFDADDWRYIGGSFGRECKELDGVLTLHPGGFGAPVATFGQPGRFSFGHRGTRTAGSQTDGRIDAGLHGAWAFTILAGTNDEHDDGIAAARGILTMLSREGTGDLQSDAEEILELVERDLSAPLTGYVAAFAKTHPDLVDPTLLERPSFLLGDTPDRGSDEDDDREPPTDPEILLD